LCDGVPDPSAGDGETATAEAGDGETVTAEAGDGETVTAEAGVRGGMWRHHFSDGSVRSESHFDRGTKSGTATYYAPDGGITTTTSHRGIG
jgi:antitoxin component YwqK of YwqJK toxin-antitoxin module